MLLSVYLRRINFLKTVFAEYFAQNIIDVLIFSVKKILIFFKNIRRPILTNKNNINRLIFLILIKPAMHSAHCTHLRSIENRNRYYNDNKIALYVFTCVDKTVD